MHDGGLSVYYYTAVRAVADVKKQRSYNLEPRVDPKFSQGATTGSVVLAAVRLLAATTLLSVRSRRYRSSPNLIRVRKTSYFQRRSFQRFPCNIQTGTEIF